MTADSALQAHLLACETALLQPEVRANATQLNQLLAEDFREIGVSGAEWTRAAVIDALREEAFTERSIRDFRLVPLADGVALVTYRVQRAANAHCPAAESLHSSIWRRGADGPWRMVFHQGTPLQAK